jgi:hypothetical protein
MKLASALNLVCYTALYLQTGDQSKGTMKRKGRGVTKKDGIFSRTPDMHKLKILFNMYVHPVGENARKLSNVIGCLVRKKISIACVDWRLVDTNKKCELWADIRLSDTDWKFLYYYWMTSEFEVTISNMKCYFTKCSY